MKKEMIIILVCMLLVVPVVNAQGQGITSELDRKFENSPNEKVDAIITFNTRPSASQMSAIRSDGANVSDEFDMVNAVVVSVPRQAAEAIANRPFVNRVEPNYDVSTVLDESSSRINADEVWNSEVTGQGVDVSIIDTGIADDNENVQTELQRDFTGEGTDDLNGHGTHVAGIVSSDDSNYRGIAPDADLFDAKALNANGTGKASDVINAIEWSVENEAEVISLSLGARVDACDGNDILSEAVDSAVSQGTSVVVAAGNYGPESETITVPGCSNRAITVGASDGDGNVADFSSRGPTADGRVKPDVIAPGVGITSTWNDGSFQSASGTSMATPHVAGVVALMLSENSELSTTGVKETIISNATDLGFEPNTQGGGLADALESYESVMINETTNETENNETEQNETTNETEENETSENETGNVSNLPPGLAKRSELPQGLRKKAGSPPGTFGHGVERILEGISLTFTFNKEKKAEKQLSYAEERLAEAQVAAANNNSESAEKAIEQYEKNIEEAKGISEETNDTRIKEMVENSTRNNVQALGEVYNKVPEQAKPGIARAINNTAGEGRPNEEESNESEDSQPENESRRGASAQRNANTNAGASINSQGQPQEDSAGAEASAEANANANAGNNPGHSVNSGPSANANANAGPSGSAPAPTSTGSPGNSGSGGRGNSGGGPPGKINGNSIFSNWF